jgi:hypothetical protein
VIRFQTGERIPVLTGARRLAWGVGVGNSPLGADFRQKTPPNPASRYIPPLNSQKFFSSFFSKKDFFLKKEAKTFAN